MGIIIGARYCGPTDSGNGGYCAGLLAQHLSGPVEVTLRRPPPLERELEVVADAAEAKLFDGDELIAEARRAELELSCPPAPSFERALEWSRRYVGHQRHHYPKCFGCGPERAAGDGLRLFPGGLEPGEPVAAPFVPDESSTDERGKVRTEIVWAALDCAGYFAAAAPDYPVALLGRMTAEVTGEIEHGERCVVLGFPLGRDGRKLLAGTAVFGADGGLRARARQIWICLKEAPASR